MEWSPFGSTSWNGLPLDPRRGMVSLWIYVMEWSPFGSTSWNGLPLDPRRGMVSLWIHVVEWSPFGPRRGMVSLWIHVVEWSPFGSTSWNGLPSDPYVVVLARHSAFTFHKVKHLETVIFCCGLDWENHHGVV